jgi:hypothetical protein
MRIQIVSKEELKVKLENSGHWGKINSGQYTAVIESKVPAKITKGGWSYIISFYDEDSTYICTIHRIKDKKGNVMHEHPKRAIIEGIEYKMD